MGLDMYLQVSEYIQRPTDWMNDEAREELGPRYEALVSLLPGIPSSHAYGVSVSYVVAYWRKANHIHKWFVDNVQDGRDECQRSYVSAEQLDELLDVCRRVLAVGDLVDGTIRNGAHANAETNFKLVDNYEDGKVLARPEVAEELLPTQGGFFFGNTGYDEYYLEDVRDTIAQLEAVLTQYRDKKGVNFYYQSSW